MSRGKGRTGALHVDQTRQTTTGSPTGSNAHGDRVPVVCAGQRHGQEGSSPSGARMRGAVSKRGGNASRAGESEGMENPKRARRRKPDTAKGDLEPPLATRRAGCPP